MKTSVLAVAVLAAPLALGCAAQASGDEPSEGDENVATTAAALTDVDNCQTSGPNGYGNLTPAGADEAYTRIDMMISFDCQLKYGENRVDTFIEFDFGTPNPNWDYTFSAFYTPGGEETKTATKEAKCNDEFATTEFYWYEGNHVWKLYKRVNNHGTWNGTKCTNPGYEVVLRDMPAEAQASGRVRVHITAQQPDQNIATVKIEGKNLGHRLP